MSSVHPDICCDSPQFNFQWGIGVDEGKAKLHISDIVCQKCGKQYRIRHNDGIYYDQVVLVVSSARHSDTIQ